MWAPLRAELGEQRWDVHWLGRPWGQGKPTSESQLPVTSCDVCQGILCPALDFRDTFPWKEPLFISVISVLTTHTTLTMDSYSPTIGFIELVVFFFPRVIF